MAGLGALALAVAALAFFFSPWVHVPDVAGRPETAAEATIDRTGLHWRRQEEPTDKAASGTVMRTAPPVGQMVDAGAVITLVIAVPIRIAIPLVITGETASEAAADLDRLGFHSRRQEEPSERAAAGTVIGAVPAPGQLADKGSMVILTIAVPVSVAVPDLTGQPIAAATAALDRIGLKWKSQQQASVTAAPGTVISVSPPAGRMLDKGSVVTLSIAVPVRIAVPALAGRSEAEAEAALNEAGFKWQIQTRPSDQARSGTVIGTSPTGGQIADKGTTVSLLVAVPVSVAVPAVVGRAEADAEAALTRAGFKWQRQTQPSDSAAAGSVIEASPRPGQNADKGTTVSLLIAVPVSVPVPPVVNRPVADAIAAIGRSGLKWQRQDVPSDSVTPGRVIDAVPAPAQLVDKGSTVILRVAAAAAVAVPRVAGVRLAEALAALGRAGLKAQRKDVTSDKVAAGRIIGTSPAEGEAVRKGATVTLLVARAVPAVHPIHPAVANPAPRYTPAPASEESLAPPGYANLPPPPSNIARNPAGYPNPAWSAPQPAPAPNPYSGAYGARVQESPGPNWLLQTGPLSGADLVGHLYDNAHR
jgi:beta-lactam-binding protein with PASTA domain